MSPTPPFASVGWCFHFKQPYHLTMAGMIVTTAQLPCAVRPFVPVFSATKVLIQFIVAGVAAVATTSMRLVALAELFTCLHRMLSPSFWFLALLMSGGICHPKEMKAGSCSFLDTNISYIHLLFKCTARLCSLWDFGCFLLWGFLLSADAWVIKFMERNHLGLAMVLGHSTSRNCILNSSFFICYFLYLQMFFNFCIYQSLLCFLYFNIFLIPFWIFVWVFDWFLVEFYCFCSFVLIFQHSFSSLLQLGGTPFICQEYGQRHGRRDNSCRMGNQKLEIGHTCRWTSIFTAQPPLTWIQKLSPVSVSTQWLSFHNPNNLMLFHMAWVGFVLRSPRVSAICRFFPWVLTKMQAARHDWANWCSPSAHSLLREEGKKLCKSKWFNGFLSIYPISGFWGSQPYAFAMFLALIASFLPLSDESIRAFRVIASLTMLWGCIFIQGSSPQPVPAGWCVWHRPSCALYAQVHKLYGCIWVVFSSGLEIPETLWQVGKGDSAFFWVIHCGCTLFIVCRCWQFWSSRLLSGCAQTDRKWLSPWTSRRFQPAGFLDAFGPALQAATKPNINTLNHHKFHSKNPAPAKVLLISPTIKCTQSARCSLNASSLKRNWNGSCCEPEDCRLVFHQAVFQWHLPLDDSFYLDTLLCRGISTSPNVIFSTDTYVSICRGFEEGPLHADRFHHHATRPKTASNKKTTEKFRPKNRTGR